MTVVGGNLERKEVGLPIGVSGTHDNTEINRTTGFLQLMQVDVDGQGRPIYTEKGSWTSDVIDLGDKFKDFEKVFTTDTSNGASSFAVLTRVSDNNKDWSDWTAIAMDGTIQSDIKQYIQVRIDLFAGFVTDLFIISKSDFEKNDFILKKKLTDSGYAVPTLTSNTSSTLGFAFASSEYNYSYAPWKAFDKADSGYYNTKNGEVTGFLGFYFKEKKIITKYKVRSANSNQTLFFQCLPKNWVLQGSNDTTNGTDGTWDDLDVQNNQSWTTINTDKVFEVNRVNKYHAYRINWSANNGYASYSIIGELDFYADETTSLSLNRDYKYDMKLDSTWSDSGSLHRKKVIREEWVKIDKSNVATRD